MTLNEIPRLAHGDSGWLACGNCSSGRTLGS